MATEHDRGINRALEGGWWLLAMHCSAGRRGGWFRIGVGYVEVCAGREGDDFYWRVEADDPAYEPLVEFCEYLHYAIDCCRDTDDTAESRRLSEWIEIGDRDPPVSD